jgi:putative RecB family exonuclease
MFTQCPKRYHFRYVLKLDEPQSEEAARGNRVHTALENLYALPPDERQRAAEGAPFTDPLDRQMFLGALELEDPAQVRVLGRELDVGFLAEMSDGRDVWMHGIIDRLDRLPAGHGITDYKTGKTPDERYAAKSIWQLLYYALCYARASKQIPVGVQLLYVTQRERLWQRVIDMQQLEVVEHKARAVAAAILRATDEDRWPATQNRLCDWCYFQQNGCPAWT